MQIGLVVPQIEMPDPRRVVELAAHAERAGFRHLLVYDHVVGIDRAARPDFVGPYDVHDPFHEPFVILGHLAATSGLQLWTGVLVLPQRQTALVAKQAAQVDLLCEGRLRLGVGIGWNGAEYEVLGADFSDRAQRYEEQVALLRLLWSKETVTFEGRFHRVQGAGIQPMPVQRPIPLWMGGLPTTPVLERIGRLADGWVCNTPPGFGLEEGLDAIRASAVAAGRDPDSIGVQGILQPRASADAAEKVRSQYDRWVAAGATHIAVSGLNGGRTPDEHIEFLEVAADALR